MLNKKKIIVVMPAYNAAKTLMQTYLDIPFEIVDGVILVDDNSKDDTVAVASKLPNIVIRKHDINKGYGANQKTCYDEALKQGADIVIMLHPDYQYEPKLITAMCSMIAYNIFPVVFGSRILGSNAIKNGMPVYKYFANRVLTFIQNILLQQKLSEYHTGYRAYSAEVLLQINYAENSNGFVFDNEMVSQIFMSDYTIGEVSCPAKYFKEASSIGFGKSVEYGCGVLRVCLQHILHKSGLVTIRRYS
jgi:glycosyltransferase involved in cell wall biosynthesis